MRRKFYLLILAGLIAILGATGTHATVHNVNIVNFDFIPDSVEVTPGDTVRWTLVSGIHTTTSLPASAKNWNSGTMSSAGQTFEIQFTGADGPGPFPYECSFHPSMQGVITMAAGPELPSVTTEVYIDSLFKPVYVTSPPNDSIRLFIVEQNGLIKIAKLGSLVTRPFIDISADVTYGGEQGLLGLAFHPQYPDSGYFYVNYTGLDGATNIVRYTVSDDPDSADAATKKTIMTVAQPEANHNAGMIDFGPDGYLYIALGDGGGGGDPLNLSQNPQELLGKMLRIDINTTNPYDIPGDNPFVGVPDTLDEIWAIGFRNPWRWSFDRLTGDILIADVGQQLWEEVNFEPAGSPGGLNYGWRLKEGTNCYNPAANCDPGGITTDPVWEYSHDGGRCSITGGFVYRGCAIPELYGYYLFGDYCSGEIWAFMPDGSPVGSVGDLLGIDQFALASFGQDAFGELYIADNLFNRILRIVPDGAPPACGGGGSCCGVFTEGMTGNANCSDDGKLTLSDITRLIDHAYISKAPLCCAAAGNTNGSDDCKITLSDISRLIDNIYISKAPTAACMNECI